MLTNLDQAGLRGRTMVNIHNPLSALNGWDKLSSDILIIKLLTPPCCLNSRLRKCVTLVVSTKEILLLCSTKYEKTA